MSIPCFKNALNYHTTRNTGDLSRLFEFKSRIVKVFVTPRKFCKCLNLKRKYSLRNQYYNAFIVFSLTWRNVDENSVLFLISVKV